MSPTLDKTYQSNHDSDPDINKFCDDVVVISDDDTDVYVDCSRKGLVDGGADGKRNSCDSNYWMKNSIVEENSTTLSDNGKRCELKDGIVEISLDSEVEGPDRGDLMEKGTNEMSSDSEVEVVEKAPDCNAWNYTSIADPNIVDTLMQDDDLHYLGELSKPENPQFRKDVEDLLRKPYDEKEYEALWLQVSLRKPKLGYRELRGRLKTYEKDTLGKSYLDGYGDLRRKLDTFENDQPRKLNVLRGFFYYLKKMADDGIFKPWLDESCLAIKPN